MSEPKNPKHPPEPPADLLPSLEGSLSHEFEPLDESGITEDENFEPFIPPSESSHQPPTQLSQDIDALESPEGATSAPSDWMKPVPEAASEIAAEIASAQPSQDTALTRIQKFAERTPIGKPLVAAAFPFSLLIEGSLDNQEKEKLLDIISREGMDIREVDLEPQFQAGKILLPRISEYAGVKIVQALRDSQTVMRLAPSDEIFSTESTASTNEDLLGLSSGGGGRSSYVLTQEPSHMAETIPVITGIELPGIPIYELIDTITAVAVASSSLMEATSGAEYEALIEALQRELKYKASQKGADAVIQFKVQVEKLKYPENYRVIATGSAIRARSTTF